MNNHSRAIQIGDYADITYLNLADNKPYRYYIVKIDIIIEVAQVTNPNQILTLNLDNKRIWQISGYDKPHKIIFNKNITDLRYIERDFTQIPIKIIQVDNNLIGSYLEFLKSKFTELKNGIILYVDNGKLIFSDISILTNKSRLKINDYAVVPGTQIVRIQSSITQETATNFLVASTPRSKTDTEIQIIVFNDEIFLYLHSTNILKLNLNDLTFEEYDRNTQYEILYPLQDKKILCLLKNRDMYILDLTLKIRINIDTTALKFGPDLEICQLSGGDVIFKYWIQNNQYGEVYRLNITDFTLTKITTLKSSFRIISKLQENKLLLITPETLEDSNDIEIWDLNTDRISYLSTLAKDPDMPIFRNVYTALDIQPISSIPMLSMTPSVIINPTPIRPNMPMVPRIFTIPTVPIILKIGSELLRSGNVLFSIDKEYYLFQYNKQEIIKLSLFVNFTKGYSFKELQNGNLIICDDQSLRILEFAPTLRASNLRNYDEIINNVSLASDLKNLIRSYL